MGKPTGSFPRHVLTSLKSTASMRVAAEYVYGISWRKIVGVLGGRVVQGRRIIFLIEKGRIRRVEGSVRGSSSHIIILPKISAIVSSGWVSQFVAQVPNMTAIREPVV